MAFDSEPEEWKDVCLQNTVAIPGYRTWWDTLRRRSPVRFVLVELRMKVRGNQMHGFTLTTRPAPSPEER